MTTFVVVSPRMRSAVKLPCSFVPVVFSVPADVPLMVRCVLPAATPGHSAVARVLDRGRCSGAPGDRAARLYAHVDPIRGQAVERALYGAVCGRVRRGAVDRETVARHDRADDAATRCVEGAVARQQRITVTAEAEAEAVAEEVTAQPATAHATTITLSAAAGATT